MPSLQKLYQQFDSKVHVLSRKMGAKASAKHYFTMLREHDIAIRTLSAEQKKKVRDVWGERIKSDCYATHELVYSVTGRFDPYICPEMLFRTHIELKMNNFQMKYGFSEKNYFDLMFPDEPMPKTVLRNINGAFLNENYQPVNEKEIEAILGKYDKLIVKPSIENGFGKGVNLYQKEQYERISKEYKKDYLVQEVLTQHSSVAALNPSSINVVRVISLSVGGKVSPVNYALRCGATGAITDNFITEDGRGMFVVGVQKDGTLKDEAFFSCGEKITMAPNGQTFAGIKLPNFEKALEMTTRIHEKLPHFGFVGFDICFDEDGEPRIMEFNIRGPGVLYYQYVNGPLFGERTQEVIDAFCKK